MNRLIEEYIAEVRAGLRGIPAERTEQEILEVRHHLTAAVEAETLAGRSLEEATREAIRRFGDARTVGRGLLRAWRRGNPSWLASPLGAVFVALGTHFALDRLYQGSALLGWLIGPSRDLDLWLRHEPAFVAAAVQGLLYAIVVAAVLGVPAAVVGAVTGYLSPRRAVSASAAVLLLPLLTAHLWQLANGATLLRITASGPLYRLPGEHVWTKDTLAEGTFVRLAEDTTAAAWDTFVVQWAPQLWALAAAVVVAATLARRARRVITA